MAQDEKMLADDTIAMKVERLVWRHTDADAFQAQKVGRLVEAAVSASPALRVAVEAESLRPLTDDPAVAALCDSNYRAGVLAGWNAANHADPAEGEREFARLRAVEPGELAPIIERNKRRAALKAGGVK